MKQTRLIMGGAVIVEIVDKNISQLIFDEVFEYFIYIDEKFSTYKDSSEMSTINRGEISKDKWSEDMKRVFELSEETKNLTNGYFDIVCPDGKYDPSGIVKGWAVFNVAEILRNYGIKKFYIEAAGDLQAEGSNSEGKPWAIGIQNPFNTKSESIKILEISGLGVATSGSYARGLHIYNPLDKKPADDIVSITVVGPNIFEADRFATASFAMGRDGITFIENLKDFEGYSIDKNGIATMTSNFTKYTQKTYVNI